MIIVDSTVDPNAFITFNSQRMQIKHRNNARLILTRVRSLIVCDAHIVCFSYSSLVTATVTTRAKQNYILIQLMGKQYYKFVCFWGVQRSCFITSQNAYSDFLGVCYLCSFSVESDAKRSNTHMYHVSRDFHSI